MVPRHLFVPEACATARTRTRRCRSAAGRRSRSRASRRATCELLGLTGQERVLEIGTGSGYQTALLALLARRGVRVERIAGAGAARPGALEAAGIRNVTVLVGDGTLGWRPFAPYDAILVAAASPEMPAPLVEQLAPGGRMVIPLGDRDSQMLTLVRARAATAPDHHRRRRAVRAAARRVRLPIPKPPEMLHGSLRTVVDFFLHLDQHLAEIIAEYGDLDLLDPVR